MNLRRDHAAHDRLRRYHAGMAKLLLNLRNVPDDEADEVRGWLKESGIEHYETTPGSWGISSGGIWIREDAQIAAAQAEMVRLGGDLERYRKLVAQKLVSQSAFDAQQAAYRAARAQYELMRNQSAYTRLLAPRDGVIATRLAEAGQTVAAGQAVYTLAGDAGREVAIAFPESRIREVGVGQPVLVELWSAPGERLPGRIREISPAADPQARTYAARVALDGEAAKSVELGQSARVYMQEHGEAAALSVPLSAVQRGKDGKSSALWVVDPTSRRVHLAPVQVGAYGEDVVPVLGGVDANAWIVAAGGHLLREGQLVAPVDRDNRPVLAAAAPAAAAK